MWLEIALWALMVVIVVFQVRMQRNLNSIARHSALAARILQEHIEQDMERRGVVGDEEER